MRKSSNLVHLYQLWEKCKQEKWFLFAKAKTTALVDGFSVRLVGWLKWPPVVFCSHLNNNEFLQKHTSDKPLNCFLCRLVLWRKLSTLNWDQTFAGQHACWIACNSLLPTFMKTRPRSPKHSLWTSGWSRFISTVVQHDVMTVHSIRFQIHKINTSMQLKIHKEIKTQKLSTKYLPVFLQCPSCQAGTESHGKHYRQWLS